MCSEAIRDLFNKNPVQLTKILIHNEKCLLLLSAIGGHWYTKIINDKILPVDKQKPSKKLQEKEDKTKINIQMEYQSWN